MDLNNKENYLLEMIINKNPKKTNYNKHKIKTIMMGNID
jgi:hypothetical protein